MFSLNSLPRTLTTSSDSFWGFISSVVSLEAAIPVIIEIHRCALAQSIFYRYITDEEKSNLQKVEI